MTRPIHEIAREIITTWSKMGKGINYAARPYLEVMLRLDDVTDDYGWDTGKSVVLYTLSNMASFRGANARRLKAELKELVK